MFIKPAASAIFFHPILLFFKPFNAQLANLPNLLAYLILTPFIIFAYCTNHKPLLLLTMNNLLQLTINQLFLSPLTLHLTFIQSSCLITFTICAY